MGTCDRCNDVVSKGHPLDSIVHVDSFVCNDCVKPWDEVVDV